MKSITLHKLNAELSEALEQEAELRGQSLNRTAQALLRQSLHLDTGAGRVDHTEDFRDLFGTWDAASAQEFRAATADLGRIDAADWS